MASVTAPGGVATGTGTTGALAAGTTDTSALSVGYTGSTASAGLVSGTVGINFMSTGQVGTGLGNAAVGSGTVTVSGSVYRLAVGSLSTTSLNLGNIRANETVNAGSLVLRNSAATDGYSDLLRYGGSSSVGFALSGGSATLAAGSSALLGIRYQGSTATAGVQSGTLTLGLTSVGQSGTGLADQGLASRTVSVFATVFRKASGELQRDGSAVAAGGTLTLAAIREGGVFTALEVDVRNTAVADVFSEKLNAVVAGTNGFGAGEVSVQQLGAGSLAAGTLSLGLGRAAFNSAGRQTGSVTVGFATDGNGTSGLATLALGAQTVQLSGDVYRLAVGSLGGGGAVTFNAIREGGTFGIRNVAVTNAASSADAFSDNLVASIATTGGGVTGSGTTGVLAAGATDAGGLSVGYTGSTAVAGRASRRSATAMQPATSGAAFVHFHQVSSAWLGCITSLPSPFKG